MNLPDETFVFHGSYELFSKVVPQQQRRYKLDEMGKEVLIFNEVAFHATMYRWIALAYMNSPAKFLFQGKSAHYNFGVGLYEYKEIVVIYGVGSLEESLSALYGNGGYLYYFEKEKFFYKVGLGNLEVITKDNLIPLKVIRIQDPVEEMRKLGIMFRFIDVSSPEHADKLYTVM